MSSHPLQGVTVVDLTRHLPGPLAAHLLADLGARVIKVEEPRAGDPVRLAPPLVRGTSALAALLLSGSRSVALDLKKDGGRRVLELLLARADVLVESFRPGTLARLGFAPEELRERFPRLIVCSVSGWGQDGPWAARAGHDLTYQATAGSLAPTGEMPAFPAADHTGAWAAVTAVLAALYERERTGQGARIDASLFDAAVHNNLVGWAQQGAQGGAQHRAQEGAHEGSGGGGGGRVGEPHGLAGSMPCYRLYRTADGGLLAVAPLEEHFWQRFCRAAGRDDLAKLQYDETEEAHRRVAAAVAERSLPEWVEVLDGADLPVEPVLTAAEAARHPQTVHRDLLRRGEDGLLRLGFPALVDGARPRAGGAYPGLGSETDRVVDELGAEVADLSPRARRRAGVGRRFSLKRELRKLALRWRR